jgi:hypothetical protein
MNINTELLHVLDALDKDGIEYALCGGLALAVHGHPRFMKQATGRAQDRADIEKLEGRDESGTEH